MTRRTFGGVDTLKQFRRCPGEVGEVDTRKWAAAGGPSSGQGVGRPKEGGRLAEPVFLERLLVSLSLYTLPSQLLKHISNPKHK